jgi:hypothetical protein
MSFCRKLAKSQNVLWCEYWQFLDCFTDLSTSEGLAKLEEYLKARSEAYMSSLENVVPLKTPVSSKCRSVGSLRGHLSGDDVFDGSECTPRSDTDQECDISATPCSRTRNTNIKNFRSRLNLDESPESNENMQSKINVECDAMDLNRNLGNTDVKRDDKSDIKTKPDIDISACQGQQANDKCCSNTINGLSPVSPDTNSLSPDCPKGSLDISNCSQDSLSGLIPEFRMMSLDESSKSEDESSKSGDKNGCISKVSECSPTEDECRCEIENTPRVENITFFVEG